MGDADLDVAENRSTNSLVFFYNSQTLTFIYIVKERFYFLLHFFFENNIV